MNTNHNESPFGKIIYSYTHSQAVADGFQVEITKTAQEAGIRFPVFITRTAFDAYVTVPPDMTGQDEAGRLWDVVWMLRFAILEAQPGQPSFTAVASCLALKAYLSIHTATHGRNGPRHAATACEEKRHGGTFPYDFGPFP